MYRGVGADFEKPIIFSAHNEQGNMKRGEKLFLKNYEIFLTLNIFGLSNSRYVPLKAELSLPSSCC